MLLLLVICCYVAVKLLLAFAAVLLLGNNMCATNGLAAGNLTTLLAYRAWSATQKQLFMQSAKGEVEQQAVPT